MIQPKISPENNITTSLQNQFLIAALVGMAFLAVLIGMKNPIKKNNDSQLKGAFFIEPGSALDADEEGVILKTYGLVYELLEANVPVTWIPNGYYTSNYSSGVNDIFATQAFMVAQSDLSPTAIEILQRWESMGTYGNYLSQEVGSPVQFRLTHFPKVSVGRELVGKINRYYESAGIPTNGYYIIDGDDASIFTISNGSTQKPIPLEFPIIADESGAQVYFDFLFSQSIEKL